MSQVNIFVSCSHFKDTCAATKLTYTVEINIHFMLLMMNCRQPGGSAGRERIKGKEISSIRTAKGTTIPHALMKLCYFFLHLYCSFIIMVYPVSSTAHLLGHLQAWQPLSTVRKNSNYRAEAGTYKA